MFISLTHIVTKNKFLGGIPQGDKTILVLLFAASVQRNQVGVTKKSKLLHGNIKSAILGVSASFRMNLWGDPTLDAWGKISLILHRQLWGYKSVHLPTKNHKAIPDKLVFHIYNKQYSHLITSIRQLIAGELFFNIQSCKYSTTPKRYNNRKNILRKGNIKFYRK